MKYTIDNDFCVFIFNDSEERPFVSQPTWPNGQAWTNRSEAELWAQMFIDAATSNSDLNPPNGPGEESKPIEIPEAPFISWVWDPESRSWQPPASHPEDGKRYGWDEDTLSWISL